MNELAERRASIDVTFGAFMASVYLPFCQRKWKASTAMTEINRIEVHLVREIGEEPLRSITREEMQKLLDSKAKEVGRSVVDHLRFRLRAIFELALSEGLVERNPATSLPHAPSMQDGTRAEGHESRTGAVHG